MCQLVEKVMIGATVFALNLAVPSFMLADQPNRGDLVLKLQHEKEIYRAGEPVVVLVSIENRGGGYHTIFPFFDPETGQSLESMSYISELLFVIEDEKGKKLRYSGDWTCAKSMIPEISEFFLLPPDFFLGRRVVLNEGAFAYDFKGPGTYRVKAIFSSSARAWLAEIAKKEKQSDEPSAFKVATAYQGRVESNELIVVIR